MGRGAMSKSHGWSELAGATNRGKRAPGTGLRTIVPARWLGAAVVAASLIAAIGGASAASGSSSQINRNGVLSYGEDLNNEFSNTFDPEKSTNDCSFAEFAQIYDSITYEPPGNAGNKEVLPGLAQSWQVQGSTLTLHIRPNVTFSDGEPVTADAVMQSLAYVKMSPLRSSLQAISSMTVTSPLTLVISLKSPPTAGDLLLAFSYIDGMVIAPNAIPTAGTKPVGSGPFELKSLAPGSEIQLVVNKSSWEASQYKLAGVNFVEVSPGPQAVTALVSGEVDMVDLQPQDYAPVRANPNLGLAITPSNEYMTLQLRQNSAPFDNKDVREALEYAVDRSAINKTVLDGLGEPAYQPFPSSSPGYNKQVGTKYQYRPAKSKALLAAGGMKQGVKMTMVIPAGDTTFSRAAQILVSEMAPAGFHVSIMQIPGGDFLTEVYEHHVGNAVLTENGTAGPDLANVFAGEYTKGGFIAAEFGSVNAQLTPLVERALMSLNPVVQGPPMQKASKIVMEDGLEVPIVYIPSAVAYNKQRVGGTVIAPIGNCRANLKGIYIKK
jgi:peptide/nickel transport system substrate-binding protein